MDPITALEEPSASGWSSARHPGRNTAGRLAHHHQPETHEEPPASLRDSVPHRAAAQSPGDTVRPVGTRAESERGPAAGCVPAAASQAAVGAPSSEEATACRTGAA